MFFLFELLQWAFSRLAFSAVHFYVYNSVLLLVTLDCSACKTRQASRECVVPVSCVVPGVRWCAARWCRSTAARLHWFDWHPNAIHRSSHTVSFDGSYRSLSQSRDCRKVPGSLGCRRSVSRRTIRVFGHRSVGFRASCYKREIIIAVSTFCCCDFSVIKL